MFGSVSDEAGRPSLALASFGQALWFELPGLGLLLYDICTPRVTAPKPRDTLQESYGSGHSEVIQEKTRDPQNSSYQRNNL
jgi:hypothetical protein